MEALLDALTDHVCLLNQAGIVVAVNQAWRDFAVANPPVRANVGVGADYYAVCAAATGQDMAVARQALAGLQAVARGEMREFVCEYLCHSPEVQRWFELRATRLSGAGAACMVLVHRSITQRRQAQMALRALTARMEEVREEERARLAREIHDEWGHTMTDLKLDLAWLARRLAEVGLTGRCAIRRRISTMSRRVEHEARAVRRLATELRPPVLDALGLVAAIEWQAREFQERTGLPCEVEAAREVPGARSPQATVVFRVFQELLSNVARHARARRVEVRLGWEAGRLILRVRDDGRGITLAEQTGPHALGLLGIQERAAAAGGEVTIESKPGWGTSVTVSLPTAGA